MKNLRYTLLLVLTAVIWGAAFVAQSAGMDYVGPFALNGTRSFIGALVLAPTAMFMDKKEGVLTSWKDKELIRGGLIVGFFLFLATSTQQIGIMTTSAGKSGFITALYIVMVPVFALMLGKKPAKIAWVSVAISLVGMYFLCIDGEFVLQKGDIFLLICAILFAMQILAVDKFAPNVDVIKLSCYQFLTCGILSIVPMLLEKTEIKSLIACAGPILYLGVLSSGVAYTLQMEAQKRVKPTVASLIMCLESVFSVLFGFLILHEKLTGRELIGCGIMLFAVVLAQLAPAKEDAIKERK